MLPQTAEEIADYMDEAIKPPQPRDIRRLFYSQAWFGETDAQWWGQSWESRQVRAQREHRAEATRENPHFTLTGQGEIVCEFVEPCKGAECRGIRLSRFGVNAAYGQEILCEYHREIWFADARQWQETMKRSPGLMLDGVSEEGTAKTADASAYVAGRDRADFAKRLQEASIPRFFSGFGLADWPGDYSVKNTVWSWARVSQQRKGLLLLGPYGVGKTGLAVGALKWRIEEHGEAGLFVTAAEMLDKLRPGALHDDELLARLQRVRVLVVDDIGAEKADTEWAQEQLWKIVNLRHGARLATLITSNLPSTLLMSGARLQPGAHTLEAHLGERTVQRFLDREAFEAVLVTGQNLRQAA